MIPVQLWHGRTGELAVQNHEQEHFRYLNAFIVYHPAEQLSVFYRN